MFRRKYGIGDKFQLCYNENTTFEVVSYQQYNDQWYYTGIRKDSGKDELVIRRLAVLGTNPIAPSSLPDSSHLEVRTIGRTSCRVLLVRNLRPSGTAVNPLRVCVLRGAVRLSESIPCIPEGWHHGNCSRPA